MRGHKLLGVVMPLALVGLLAISCRQASPPPPPAISEVGQRTVQHGLNTQTYASYLMGLGREQGRASLEIEAARWLEMGKGIEQNGEKLITFAPLLNIPSRGTQPQKARDLELDDLWADGMLLRAYGERLISEHRSMKMELLKQLNQGEITEAQLTTLILDCNYLEEAGGHMLASGQFMLDYVRDFQRSIGAPPYGTAR